MALYLVSNGNTLEAADINQFVDLLGGYLAAAQIVGGSVSISLRNNANSADNLLVEDAGAVTLRNSISLPPSAGGTVAPGAGYGSLSVKIDEAVLSSATSSVNIGGATLPTGFRHLELFISARGDTAAAYVECGIRFNGDTGSNYAYERATASGTTVAAQDSSTTAQTSGRNWYVSAASAPAGWGGHAKIWIPDHARTTFNKVARIESTFYAVTTAFPSAAMTNNDSNAIAWNSTAAITRLDAIALTGNFAAGSIFTLWGWP